MSARLSCLALRLAVLGAGIALAGVGLAHLRHEVAWKRVKVVVPGKIVRGGEQQGFAYERLVTEHGIRTIVTLLGETDEAAEREEAEIASRHGIEIIRLPMPGDGRGSFARIDAAAAILADPRRQPVFVHCSAGVHRTGAAVAAYRVEHEGWDFDRAMVEMDLSGADFGEQPQLYEHMVAWRATVTSSPASAGGGDSR